MIKQSTIVLLLITITVCSGCSRFKGLTRGDYALLKDPFARKSLDKDGDSLADSDEPPVEGIKASTAGFVEMDAPSEPAGTTGLSDRATADYSGASDTRTAAKSSSGFNGIRVRGMGNAISTDIGPSVSDFVGKQPDPIATDATVQNSPTAGNNNMADMAAFIQGQAAASGLEKTAEALDEDFAAYAAEKKEMWNEEVARVNETAAPLIRQVSQKTESTQKVTNDVLSGLTNGTAQDADQNTATPLIRERTSPSKAVPLLKASAKQPVGTPSPFAPVDPKVQPRTAPVAQPIFDPPPVKTEASPEKDQTFINPFSAFESENEVEASQPQAPAFDPPPKKKALDSGFSFDSGWRPSGVVNP